MKKLIFMSIVILAMLSLNACAPTMVNVTPAPDYYSSETIPIVVGMSIDEPPFTAQCVGASKIQKDYGPIVVDYLIKMKVFKNIVYPYEKENVDAVLSLSIRGKWDYHRKGRWIATLLIGTPDYIDVEGTHTVKAILKKGNTNTEIANYDITVNTTGQYSGTDTDMITDQLNSIQIKKIAVELANKIHDDRAKLLESIKEDKNRTSEPATSIQNRGEVVKTNINKLDKLHKSGIISDEEYKSAKNKLISSQSDSILSNDKLQELDELHKTGVLSDADYDKAKKRLSETQKLNELYENGILSKEEYLKAKERLLEK